MPPYGTHRTAEPTGLQRLFGFWATGSYVESAIVSQIQATQIRATPLQMENLRQMCSRVVAQNSGIITFEDAYKQQHK